MIMTKDALPLIYNLAAYQHSDEQAINFIQPHYAFGSWNELFRDTTRLNTGRPGSECFGSTLK